MSTDHTQQPSALPTESIGDGSGPSPKRIGGSPSFTPGPWEVWGGNRVVHETPEGSRRLIAETPGRTPEEGQANARLVAAAPDLLAAAELVIAELNARMEAAPGNAVPVFRGLVELYTAANKAKGLI